MVADQIRLWEQETLRVQESSAVLYDNFETRDLHQRAVQYAKSHGLYMWNDEYKLVINKEGE